MTAAVRRIPPADRASAFSRRLRRQVINALGAVYDTAGAEAFAVAGGEVIAAIAGALAYERGRARVSYLFDLVETSLDQHAHELGELDPDACLPDLAPALALGHADQAAPPTSDSA